MRFLKKKLQATNKISEYFDGYLPLDDPQAIKRPKKPHSTTLKKNIEPNYNKYVNYNEGIPDQKRQNRIKYALKNVEKNFGQAICNFILSPTANEMIQEKCRILEISIRKFKNFAKTKLSMMRGTETLRAALLPHCRDKQKHTRIKKLFQEMGILFIKYYSVSWIYEGKILEKMVYLKSRFRMLRRFQNPENFSKIK